MLDESEKKYVEKINYLPRIVISLKATRIGLMRQREINKSERNLSILWNRSLRNSREELQSDARKSPKTLSETSDWL